MNTMPSIRQILASLGRRKTMLAIIVMQIALTCAILCNALDVIVQRVDRFTQPSGVDEERLIAVTRSSHAAGGSIESDLQTLRAVPGVSSVSVTLSAPMFSGIVVNGKVRPPEENDAITPMDASFYAGDEQMLPTLGVRLLAGRNVSSSEVSTVDNVMKYVTGRYPVALVSASVAEHLYPGQQAVGRKILTLGSHPSTIIGVYEDVHSGRSATPAGLDTAEPIGSAIIPARARGSALPARYLVRVDPEVQPDTVAAAIVNLPRSDGSGMLAENVDTYTELRATLYEKDIAMAWLLGIIMVALLAINAFGIVGLSSFWVQQRTAQIGIRRALGATRSQIVRYFQVENLLIVSVGIALGMLLAFALNQLLMGRYELPRLSWQYLPAGALLLWALGQMAVLGPALRAAAVPPAMATRSV